MVFESAACLLRYLVELQPIAKKEETGTKTKSNKYIRENPSIPENKPIKNAEELYREGEEHYLKEMIQNMRIKPIVVIEKQLSKSIWEQSIG